MNRVLFITLLLISLQSFGQASREINGRFFKKNLYIVNPMTVTQRLCIDSIYVNRVLAYDSIKETGVEVDFTELGYQCGDSVNVIIYHKNDCSPSPIGPEIISPKATVEYVNVTVTQDGVLEWYTSNEMYEGTFKIEQKLWGIWHTIDEVPAEGTPCQIEQKYQRKVALTHGINEFRVRKHLMRDSDPSMSAKTTSGLTPAEGSYDKSKKSFVISRPTVYRVEDQKGEVVVFGQGNLIDMRSMKKGEYTIHFDSSTTTIKHK